MKKEESNQQQSTERSAIVSLIKRFGWTFEDWMQDWPLEISKEVKIENCLNEYRWLSGEAEKVLLMKAILYALEESADEERNKHLDQVTGLLEKDFKIHEATIYYWTLYGSPDFEKFRITPRMLQIWDNKK